MEIFQWQPHVREQRDVLDSIEMFWWEDDDGDNNPARSEQLLVHILQMYLFHRSEIFLTVLYFKTE